MDTSTLKIVLITAFCFALFVVVPIIAIMTEHQRKMARLMRGDHTETNETAEILAALNGVAPDAAKGQELRELRDRVSQLEVEVAELKGAGMGALAAPSQEADSIAARTSSQSGP